MCDTEIAAIRAHLNDVIENGSSSAYSPESYSGPDREEMTFWDKVLGGNSSLAGTPDGLAGPAIAVADFFTEDFGTLISEDATAGERSGGIYMDKKLEGILDILDKLNSSINIVNKEDLDEQYENLEHFRMLTRDLDTILNNFGSLDKNNGDEIEKMLFELHRIITTFEWHFSEISDLNTTILKVYKDKINNV